MPKVAKERSEVSQRLSFYIHIPYCIKRCGYCDFNTYTPAELQGPNLATVSESYISAALSEIARASTEVGAAQIPSIFFGGGTPSLMPAADLARVINEISQRFELTDDVEITIEVNPDSVTAEFLEQMRLAGANRISMGMQSAVPHVLKVLDRTHNPENVASAMNMARAAGYEHLSVDLIYGAPGENMSDWQKSVSTALELPIDHISAYALIVEKGTKLAAQINRGELNLPPDDETAEKYLFADESFTAAGFAWYELSNWSKPGGECKHNIAYWDGSYWWGVGPGAHSYFNNQRWWNVKHPTQYQHLITQQQSPVQNREQLTSENLADEYLLLQIRRRDGIPHARLSDEQLNSAKEFFALGHFERSGWEQGKLVLSQSGRLLADRIVRALVV